MNSINKLMNINKLLEMIDFGSKEIRNQFAVSFSLLPLFSSFKKDILILYTTIKLSQILHLGVILTRVFFMYYR